MFLIRKCFLEITDLFFYSVGFLICHQWNSWVMFLKVCYKDHLYQNNAGYLIKMQVPGLHSRAT